MELPFSADNFEPFEVQSLTDSYKKLCEKFPVKFDYGFQFDLGKHEILSDYKQADAVFALDIGCKNINSRIVFAKVTYAYIGYRGSSHVASEFQSYAVTTLQKNYGHIFIRPETLINRIQEFLKHTEVDIEDKEFSKKYSILANDADKAKSFMTPAVKQTILEINNNDYFIEVLENKLIIGNKQMMEPEATMRFAEFINKLSSFL